MSSDLSSAGPFPSSLWPNLIRLRSYFYLDVPFKLRPPFHFFSLFRSDSYLFVSGLLPPLCNLDQQQPERVFFRRSTVLLFRSQVPAKSRTVTILIASSSQGIHTHPRYTNPLPPAYPKAVFFCCYFHITVTVCTTSHSLPSISIILLHFFVASFPNV